MGAGRSEQSGEWVGGISVDVLEDPVSEAGEPVARPTRRGLLLGAAGVVAGRAVWWSTRHSDKQSGPGPKPVSGPEPLWTHQDSAPLAADRLNGRSLLPLFVTASDLLVLDPGSGRTQRRIRFPNGGADDSLPPGFPSSSKLLLATEQVIDSTIGHITGRHLTDSSADWEYALPSQLGGARTSLVLDAAAGPVLFGRSMAGVPDRAGDPVLFAFSTRTREPLWTRSANESGGYLSNLQPAHGDLLVARSTRDELVAIGAADGTRRWLLPADQGLGWLETDAENVYFADHGSGLRAVRLTDGSERWVIKPGEGENWRCLKPLAGDGAVFVLRDNGLLTRNNIHDGSQVWSCLLPFRLDSRCSPVLVGERLYVPGPAAGGVCALDTATGAVGWTFRDSGPGVDVWRLSTDGTHLFAGHDKRLYALPGSAA